MASHCSELGQGRRKTVHAIAANKVTGDCLNQGRCVSVDYISIEQMGMKREEQFWEDARIYTL